MLISNADDFGSTLVGECIRSAADKFCAYFKEIKIITRELTAIAAPFLHFEKIFENFDFNPYTPLFSVH